MGELPHARIQAELFYRLLSLADSLGLQVLPEIRIHAPADPWGTLVDELRT